MKGRCRRTYFDLPAFNYKACYRLTIISTDTDLVGRRSLAQLLQSSKVAKLAPRHYIAKMQQWKAFAVVAAVLLAAASANAQECVSTAIKVTNTGTKPAQPVNESTAFDQVNTVAKQTNPLMV